ncbi:AGAP004824-PA-like protein [Anopheles sinensis]|uniref:Eukaryotic translation initiation factor 5B n=1 Tax=Anopheles sinensis TaxID=74873 RepID=A0A084VU86_ANOSI|nr:AGAP004824-PA-like protein [Anopheles sinensis]
MGKAKKGKKEAAAGAGVEENTSDVETVPQTDLTEIEVENRKNDKKSKKDKKAKKAASDSDNDEEQEEVAAVAESMKKLAVSKKKDKKASEPVKQQAGSDSGDGENEGKEKEVKKKKGAKSGPPEEVVRKQSADGKEGKGKKAKAPQTKKEPPKEEDDDGAAKGGKKGKKKKKKADEDDDEIERMLAELDMEYSGQKPAVTEQEPEAQQPEKVDKKKDKKKKKDEPVAAEVKEKEARPEEADDGVRLKTAAEKKKEKKERQKAAAKQQDDGDDDAAGKQPEEKPSVAPEVEPSTTEGAKKAGKKKGKKEETAASEAPTPADAPAKAPEGEKAEGGDEAAAGEGKKKKPNKAALAVMQERLKAIREEEERLRKEEEEKQRLEEQAEAYRLEQLKLEQEKKEKKKQREKERKERLKAEGKLLSAKQKQDRARAQAMLEALKAQGVEVPEATGERRMRPGTRIRPKKNQEVNKDADGSKETTPTGDEGGKEGETKVEEKPKEKEIKESWDASDSEEEEVPAATGEEKDKKNATGALSQQQSREAEKMRQRALDRIAKRTQDAEKKKTLENLRAAVVCVLGHVDTGKTKILDKLRRTNVQDGEAGGITQQIGATNVPAENIKEQTKFVKGFQELEFKLPGLLIIDTPGHESFSNLRSRGSSLCDIAILVVDIMHGLEPQTLESINLLKSKRTPFVVALNKIDRLYDWNTMPRKDVRDILKGQASNTQLEFTQRTKEIIVQFAEQGLNAALFYENPDPKTYVSLVPTSAITGEGMGNLLFLIVQFCQKQLAKRLMYSEDLQATVLEVKAIPGLGTTIDAILINGKLREGDTMILAGTEGPIVTQIKALLMPQPMKELRVKNAYVEHKEIMAAQGVKIAAKELEKAIAGLNLQIAQKPDEVEIFRDIVARDLKSALNSIKLSDRGVYVQASTLGSLEALLEFLRTSKIPYSGIRIGPVVKRDVMKASTMLEHENQFATILAFDVKVERDAQELADNLGVKIFQADIIYHLFDKFMAYREEIRQRKRDEFKQIAVFPCKLKILPQFVFNSRDPIVMGVIVEAGIVKEGTPITVPSREFTDLGVVTSIEANHKQIESARKGQEVCIKIEPIPSETPKMFGRHFDETDMLVSKISRQSIDACKDYFRDDLLKSDWTLMVELKKTFQIL